MSPGTAAPPISHRPAGTRRAWLARAAALGCALAMPTARAGAYDDWFKAIELDRPALLQRLLDRGFDVNTRDAAGQHGLYVALREGADGIVSVLLTQPSLDVESANAAGETLLMMAALRGRLDAMATLIARGARVRRPGWTPLHYAASGQEPQAIALLLAHDADIDARSPNGSTPLMMAAGYGAIDGADLLLRRGADPALRNQAGLGAADLARRADRDRLAERIEAAERQRHTPR